MPPSMTWGYLRRIQVVNMPPAQHLACWPSQGVCSLQCSLLVPSGQCRLCCSSVMQGCNTGASLSPAGWGKAQDASARLEMLCRQPGAALTIRPTKANHSAVVSLQLVLQVKHQLCIVRQGLHRTRRLEPLSQAPDSTPATSSPLLSHCSLWIALFTPALRSGTAGGGSCPSCRAWRHLHAFAPEHSI